MSWDDAIKFTLSYEGSRLTNDPNDLGGETKYGIAKTHYPNEDIPNMTEERAKMIYRRDFWDAIMGDSLPAKLAACVFDAAVNQGPVTAVKMLQDMLDVSVDGTVGPQTLKAAALTTDYHVYQYLLVRARRYMQTTNAKYWGWNWGSRLIKFQETFLKDELVV